MRRGLVVGVQTAVLLLAGALPALSHAIFPGQGPLAAQADQTLTMAVPEERDPDTHNVGVTVALPASWTAVSCKANAPWTCALVAPSGANPAQIQWTRNPAPPPVPDDVTFVFTVHTGGPGSYPIPVNQTYNTGEIVRWIGPPNAGEPAPVLTVSAPPATPTPPAPVTPSAPAPAPHPSPTPAPVSPHPAASMAHPPAVVGHASPTVSSAPPSTSPTATDTATSSPTPTTTVISAPNDNSGKKVSSGGSGATLVTVAVVVVALLGGGWALLRRRAHGAP